MIIKAPFKKLKTNSLFDFGKEFYVKTGKNTARRVGIAGQGIDIVEFMFVGSEIVECDDARLKSWWHF